MTNTIPNVPRELLEDCLIAARGPINGNLAERLSALLSAPSPAGVDADHVEDVRAMVADPSPAGVDGLEVVAWVTTGFSGKSRTRRAFTVNADDAARQHTNWTPHYRQVNTDQLCRLSAAQAIIDGLRGENERIRLNIAEYNEAISCYQSERDQQGRRIGELEGLLREAGKTIHKLQSEQPTPARIARYLDAMRTKINAAMSAGKEGE